MQRRVIAEVGSTRFYSLIKIIKALLIIYQRVLPQKVDLVDYLLEQQTR